MEVSGTATNKKTKQKHWNRGRYEAKPFFYLQFYHHHLYHSHTEEYFCSQLLSPVVLAVDPAQIVAATVEDAGVVSDVVQTLAACWAATASGCVWEVGEGGKKKNPDEHLDSTQTEITFE